MLTGCVVAGLVVTLLLVNPDNIRTPELEAVFASAGIVDLIFVPTATQWPTLSELISANKRLIVFLSTHTTNSYILTEFDHIYETPYQITAPSQYNCSADRGVEGNIPLMNHFMYEKINANSMLEIYRPNETYTHTLNSASGEGNLKTRLEESCKFKRGFVLIDFFNGKEEMSIIDAVNGVTDATGRKPVPEIDRKPDPNSSKSSESEKKTSAAGRGQEGSTVLRLGYIGNIVVLALAGVLGVGLF